MWFSSCSVRWYPKNRRTNSDSAGTTVSDRLRPDPIAFRSTFVVWQHRRISTGHSPSHTRQWPRLSFCCFQCSCRVLRNIHRGSVRIRCIESDGNQWWWINGLCVREPVRVTGFLTPHPLSSVTRKGSNLVQRSLKIVSFAFCVNLPPLGTGQEPPLGNHAGPVPALIEERTRKAHQRLWVGRLPYKIMRTTLNQVEAALLENAKIIDWLLERGSTPLQAAWPVWGCYT